MIPGRGKTFSVLQIVQMLPRAHPASFSVRTDSFLVVKQPIHEFNHPIPFCVEVNNEGAEPTYTQGYS